MGSRSSSMYGSSGNRRRLCTLLLLAVAAAMLSALVVHKLREARVLGLVLEERERQLFALHMILQGERSHSKELKIKIEELKAKATNLKNLKMQLTERLIEAEEVAGYLRGKRAELESALREKQHELSSIERMEEASREAYMRDAALPDLLRQQRDRQPASAAPAGGVQRRNGTDEGTGKEEVAGGGDDNGNQAIGSAGDEGNGERDRKGEEWVRVQTNADLAEDGDNGSGEEEDRRKGGVSAEGEKSGEEDHGKEGVSGDGRQSEDHRNLFSEEGRHAEGETRVDGQNPAEIRDENQIDRSELLRISTSDGEIPVMKASSNITEAGDGTPGDDKLEAEDNSGEGSGGEVADTWTDSIQQAASAAEVEEGG